jgi:hypothetical protein
VDDVTGSKHQDDIRQLWHLLERINPRQYQVRTFANLSRTEKSATGTLIIFDTAIT